ncbi:hypothetical protein, partial [Proteus mirabilis]|uniref:hypothetical protein n=1 Tax=Proteus mirabilis TaxID=584 RepID=UPI003D9CBCA4
MKTFKMNKTKLGITLITFLSSGVALASGETSSGVDLSSLTNAVDFGSVLVGIMAVAASIITLYAGFALMNPLMILVKIIKLRWIHILSYDQMVSRKINNQTTRCANSIF